LIDDGNFPGSNPLVDGGYFTDAFLLSISMLGP